MTKVVQNQPVWAVLKLSVALLLVFGLLELVDALELTQSMLNYHFGARPALGEVVFLAALALLAVPATLLLSGALEVLAPGLLTRLAAWARALRPATVLGGLVLVGVTSSFLVRHFVTRGADFTDDERLYWYQAQVLLNGSVLGPLPPVDQVFQYQFITHSWTGEGLAGLFTIGQPLLLAFGSLVGARDLTQELSVAALVVLTWHLAEQLHGDAWVTRLATALVASSPWLAFASASRHNGVPTAACTASALLFALDFARRGGLRSALLAGGSTALVFLIRSLDGVLLVVWISGLWLPLLLRAERGARRARWIAAVAGGAGALLLVSPQLYVNFRSTGQWLKPAYSLWLERDWPGAHLFGFGRGAWNFEQTPGTALLKTVVALARVGQWFAGNLLGPVAVGLALAVPTLRRPMRAVWLYAGLMLCGYGLFLFPSVHDFGSVYHLALLPLLGIAAAASARWLGRRLGGLRVLALVLAAGLVSVPTFWAVEARRLHALANGILAPLELADREASRVGRPIIVLWRSMQGEPLNSWVFMPPPLSPLRTERVIWARDEGREQELAAAFPGRPLLRLEWNDALQPTLEPVVVP